MCNAGEANPPMSNHNMDAYYDRYVEAWNEHDPEAVMAQFADGGTFDEPVTDEPLTGEEIGEWIEAITDAMPDVHFELGRRISNGEGLLFAEFTMHGSHDGPLQGLPATHRTVDIDVVEVVTLSGDGITSITGYFDRVELNEQLGLTFPAVIGQLPKLAAGAVRNIL